MLSSFVGPLVATRHRLTAAPVNDGQIHLWNMVDLVRALVAAPVVVG